jgi:uncharacterized surface protein with fasciclin (FAS1) repeats
MTRLFKRKGLFIQWLFLSSLCFAIGCSKGFKDYYDDKNTKGGFLYDKIKSNPEFSTFAAAIERANIKQFISEGGLYTVFAPTNEAFSKFLSNNGYSSIDAVPLDRLYNILSYHIIYNMWYYYDLKVRYSTYKQIQYLTRNRKFVDIDVTTPDVIKINGVRVVNSLRDIDADNGVIHGIEDVLVPLPNLEEVFQSDPELKNSTFYKLMQVVADSAFDRFNSFDKNRDGIFDSVFYKTYPLLNNVFTTIEYRQNTAPTSQGGEPLFTTVLVPSNAALDALIAPALARIDNSVQNKIAALSPSYAEAILEYYFISDSLVTSSQLINRSSPTSLRSVNSEVIPSLTANQFLRKDIRASNGLIHLINTTFAPSSTSVLNSALGKIFTDPNFSMFLAAIQKAGQMVNWASTTKTGTFFAPTNDAFIAAGFDVQKGTLNGGVLTSTQFTNIVRNHLVNENLTQANLTVPTVTKNSDMGQALVFTTANGVTTVTTTFPITATVSFPEAGKGPGSPTTGWVYKVNKLLLPKQ